MKKILISAFALFMVASTTFAAVSPITLIINGEQINPSVAPQIINGSTMVPLRVISETLGADVQWDDKTRTVTVKVSQTAAQEPTGLSLAELNEIGESVPILYAYKGDTMVSQGSGFVANGVLFTNYHVIDEGVTQIVAAFGWDKEYTIKVSDALFVNEKLDIAGFSITGVKGLRFSTIPLNEHDIVYSLGHPDRVFRVTEGEFWRYTRENGKFFHNAKTGNGASGGPIINSRGEVVGVNVSGNDEYDSYQGIIIDEIVKELNKIK